MQEYFDELSELITQVEIEDSTGKEAVLVLINNVVDGYVDRIKFDETLTNEEKQFVIENVIFKSNYEQ